MSTPDPPTVLVVEDEPDVAESYELMLGRDFDVTIASTGEAALDLVEDADVVLLDRMLPGMAGTEVLREIRSRGFDVPIAIVSAVDPDFDVVEMGFDDYVQKPPTSDQLRETIEDLLERRDYESEVREYYSLLSRKGALEAEKTKVERSESAAYHDLEERIESLRTELEADDDLLLDDATFIGTLRDLTGDSDGGAD